MKRRKLLTFLVIGALILLAALIYVYIWYNNNNKDYLYLYGNVDVRQVDIGFRVPGRVAKLMFEEGDRVCSGQLMASLDDTPYISQNTQAEETARSAKATLENAEILLKRREELIRIGGVSQEDLDNARASVNTSRANLAAAEAAARSAQDNLTFINAFAPTDGVILTRIREPGTVVNPSDPVYTLSVSSPVWIRAFVSEVNLGNIYYGMPAEISIDTPGAPVYTGKIGFISPVAEFTPKTVETTQLRTDLVYRLRIYVDNPDHILKQGMPVTVKINLSKQREQGAAE